MNKLTLLVIEDVKPKQRKIKGLLRARGLDKKFAIAFAGCVTTAKERLAACVFDVVLLDQNLPEWENEAPQKHAGLEILRDLNLTDRSKRPSEVIVLSGFPLQKSPRDSVAEYGCTCIPYDEVDDSWKKQLVARLENILYLYESGRLSHRRLADVAIIVALDDPEFEPFRDAFFGRSGRVRAGETRLCVEAVKTIGGQNLRLVSMPIGDMGLVAACEATLNLIHRYHPRMVIMSGIAGKVGDTVQLCDIVVADQSWNYDAGKWIEDDSGAIHHQPEPRPIGIDARLRAICADFAGDPTILGELRSLYQSLAPRKPKRKHELNILVGPVVSGSSVVESKAVVARAGAVHRKTLALDMEVFGVYHACKCAFGPKPLFVAAKAVSDKARVGGKTNKYRKLAARLSARFVQRLLERKGSEILDIVV